MKSRLGNRILKLFSNRANSLHSYSSFFFGGLRNYSKAFALVNLVNLVTTPMLLHFFGPSIWTSIVLAQLVGQIFSVLIDAGFSTFGANDIKKLDNNEKINYLNSSVGTRLIIFLAVFPFYLLIHFFIIGNLYFSGLAIGISSLVQGLNSSWYQIATGNSAAYMRRIVLPKSFAGLIGTIVSVLSNSVGLYGPFLLAASVYSAVPDFRNLIKIKGPTFYRSLGIARKNALSIRFALNISGNVFNYIPILVLGTINTHALPQAALADKISKYILGFSQPVVAATQGAIFNVKQKEISEDIVLKRFLIFLIQLSFPFMVIFTGLFPLFSSLISSGTLRMDFSHGIPVSITTYCSILYWFYSSVFITRLDAHKLALITNSLAISLVSSVTLIDHKWSLLQLLWIFAISASIPILILTLVMARKLNKKVRID